MSTRNPAADKPPTARDPTWKPRKWPATATSATLANLAPGACRWPVGPDPGDGMGFNQLFCADQAESGCSYCATHGEVARKKRGNP